MRRCYPILTPFKFKGAIVKPGAFPQFDEPAEGEEHSTQALQYIGAGVIDPEWFEAPEAEADRVAAEQAEADRVAAEQAETDRVAAEQAEADRVAAEQAEADRVAAEKANAKPAKGKAK